MICPKCGQQMSSPKFDTATGNLIYVCLCGFQKSSPSNDAKPEPDDSIRRFIRQHTAPKS